MVIQLLGAVVVGMGVTIAAGPAFGAGMLVAAIIIIRYFEVK